MRGIPFKKGADIRRNPGARRGPSVGLASYIRSRMKDGRALADAFMLIAQGAITIKQVVVQDGLPVEVDVGPNFRERMDAMRWLADRAYGKAYTSEPVDEEASDTHGNVTDSELVSRLQALPAPKG